MRIDLTPRQVELFWQKVDRSGGPDACWLWTASCVKGGYGQFGVTPDRNEGAHRVSYLIAYGEIPDETPYVLHTCDVRRCVNPAHLFAGTQRDNILDCISKQRFYCQLDTFVPTRGTRSGMAKLTDDLVREIRQRCAEGEVARTIALDLGVSRSLVSEVKRGNIWKHVK